MSLLGPSLHSLNQRHRPAVKAQLGGYARGMLAALEGLHEHGVSRSAHWEGAKQSSASWEDVGNICLG